MVKIKKYKDEIEKEVYKQMDVYKNILNAELVINAIRAVMYEHDKITNPSYGVRLDKSSIVNANATNFTTSSISIFSPPFKANYTWNS